MSDARINPYWFGPTIAIAVPLIVGPLGAWLGVLRPDTGFMLVGMGALLALISAILLPAAAALASATGRPWRRSALIGAVGPGVVVLAALIGLQLIDAPPINDVSTDLDERPELGDEAPVPDHLAEMAEQRMSWLAEVQRESYPDLRPIRLPLAPDAAFARARETARQMPRWEVTRVLEAQGRIEATATSRVFGFVDDVVIRVRPDPSGTRVDLRSRSRLGRGDLGANAARIRAYARRLRQDVEGGDP